jgi:putative addiction module killer protein
MNMKQIEVFKLENGKKPFIEWFKTLDKKTKKRISQRIDRIEEEGYYGDFKKINNELSELRFKFGSGYRVYFSEIDNIIVLLLYAGDKSTQSKDIDKAKEYLKLWKGYKNENK